MPYADWQFWLVTLLCLIALYVLVRPFLPAGQKNKCCSTKNKAKKTKLTISSTTKTKSTEQ